MQRVTIKDIARLAGVSVTTVSRVLNHAPEVNAATRERVLQICREQSYHTNLLARSLISNRTNMLGLILPDIANPFHAALSLNIETCAQEADYQVMLCSGHPEDGEISSLFDLLISQQVDGILLSSASNSAPELLSRYHDTVPCMLLGSCTPDASGLRVNAVSADNYVGGRMAAEYLHRLGHRNVIYLGLRANSATHTLRHLGFLSAAQELGMTVKTVENPTSSSSIESGYQMARKCLQRPLAQTAVFAASDAVALGAIQVADQMGISIPGELSLLGFDNIEYAALPNIRLTTLSQNAPLLCRSAVQLLLELIGTGERTVYTQKLVTPTLVERSTCRAIAAE